MKRHRLRMLSLICLTVGAIVVLLTCPLIGMEAIPLGPILRGSSGAVEQTILWQIRVPRVWIGFLCGAGLAVCGTTFQAMFRNSLATPFTLGVASGASLGAAIGMRLGLTVSLLGLSGVSMCAFLGALGAIALVSGLTHLRKDSSMSTMLLAGVAVTMFFSSLILLLQYLSDFAQSFQIIRWLMGGLDTAGYESAFSLFPVVLLGAFWLFLFADELNLLTTGRDLAISRGVDVAKTNKILFTVTSLTIGGIVAVCGPIGFVGMIVPHTCRLLVGWDHRYLMPASFLLGGIFLCVCDTVARTWIAPAEIPVGVITALLGGPFFLWLLLTAAPVGAAET
jgi:cobalamin transport system permease protein